MTRLFRVLIAAVAVAGLAASGPHGETVGSPVQADLQARVRSQTAVHQNLTRFSFGVYSDIHMSENAIAVLTRDRWATLLRQWRDAGHLLALIVGDLGFGNPGDPANVLSGPAAVPNAPPVFYSMGNHEVDGIGKRAWIDALYPGAVAPGSWTPAPGLAPGNGEHVYYSFDIGPSTHFIVLDGDHMTYDGITARVWQTFGQKQLSWLAADIAANPTKNLMVFVHEPIDHQATGSTPYYTLNDKGSLIDLLSAHPKQTVVFSGHLHGHRGVTRWRGITSVHVNAETVSTYGAPPILGVRVDIDGEAITISHAGGVTEFDQHPMNAVQTVGANQVVAVAEDGGNSGVSRLPSMSIVGAENGVAPTSGGLMLKTGAISWFATRFISEQLIKIRPGMKFSYDMWLSGVVGGNDAVAVQPSWHMKDGSLPPRVVDQNGLAMSQRPRDGKYYLYNDDLPRLNNLATDRWYHREFDLSALAGHYVDGVYLAAAATRVNVGAVYVDNIRFTWPAVGPAPNAAPTVTLTGPASGSNFVVGTAIPIAATAADSDGTVAQVAFYAGAQSLGVDTSAPYQVTWANAAAGSYSLTAVATDNAGATRTSAAVPITVQALQSGLTSATFIGTDAQTRGSWKGVYGAQGYSIANDGTSLPAYATLARPGGASWTWLGSTSDTRALQKAVGADRIASTWYGSFDTQIGLSDGQTHQLAVYVVDWDNRGRTQTIQIVNTTTGWVLDERSVSGFSAGRYVIWNVKGNVSVRLRADAGPNAVYSAIFLDAMAGQPVSANTATFVGSDASTQGTWKGRYGAGGYALANDGVSLPAYATLTQSGSAAYTWLSSTTDLRALQKSVAADRIAATWYGGVIDATINLTDGQAHQISLYVLDWDLRGRTQTVQVLDAATGAVLDSRTISAFSGGQYVTWSITGRVTIRVTQTGPSNAVYGGVFFNQ